MYSPKLRSIVILIALLAISTAAYAAFDWSGATDNVWSTDTNWTGGTAPVAGAVSDSLTFGSDAGDFTVTGADGAYTDISAISFDTAAGAYSISGAGSFSLDAGGTIGGTSGFAHTIGVNLVSNAGGGIVFNGTDDFSISSIISGAGGLTQSGTGTLTLSGVNTYSGGTTLSGGMVIAGNDAAFGSGAVTVTADSVLQSDDDARAISNAIGINAGQTLTVSGTNNLALSGIVSGDGSLTKSGTNILTLSGVNTYTGGTSLGGGTVIAGNDAAFGSGAVTVTADSVLQSDNDARSLSNAISVAAGQALTVSGTNNLGLSGVVSGTGSLSKSGTNTLTLSGVNTYTGGTSLGGGTVIAGNDAAFGSGAVTVTADSVLQSDDDARAISNAVGINTGQTLTVSGTNNLGLSGIVSGDGSLTKSGTNTLTLSGVNTYTGGTSLGGGTVIAGDDAAFGSGAVSVTADSTLQSDNDARSISNAISVAAGQSLTVSGTNNLTLSGIVSGTGSLTQSGTNTLTLSGVNTYSGGTTLSDGIVIAADDAAFGSGAITVAADSAIQSDNDARTLSNNMTLGAGQTLTILGTNNLGLSGVLSGTGGLDKDGTGILTLTGVNTYTGATTLSSGTLVLNGQVAGDVAVDGGTLMGTGTVAGGGNLTLNNGGTFAPGNSIGTTTVTGDYVQNAGSTLSVEIFKDAGGVLSNDQIDVTGTATLEAGSTIEVTDTTPTDRFIGTGDTFDIITAAGGVTDNGATINSLSASLSFTGSIVGNDYILTATRSAFGGSAATGNNAAVLGAIDADMGSATGDFVTVINELSALGAAELNSAAEQLIPLPHASTAAFSANLNQSLLSATASYLGNRRRGSLNITRFGAPVGQESFLVQAVASPGTVRDAKAVTPSVYGQSRNIYLQPFGMYYDQDSTEEFTGFHATATGFNFGFDEVVNDNWIAGLNASYMHSWLSFDNHLGDGDIDSFRVGPYASYFKDDFYLDAMLSFGYHFNETERDVNFGGINRTAKADYDSYDFSAYLGGGYDIDLPRWTLTPTASLQYMYSRTEDFRESGAGAAGLEVDANTQQSLLSRIGVRLHTLTEIDSIRIAPEVFAGYAHEFMDEESMRSRLLGGTTKFTTNVDNDRRDSIYFGAGVSGTLNENTSLFLRYEGEVYSANETHVLTGGLTLLF